MADARLGWTAGAQLSFSPWCSMCAAVGAVGGMAWDMAQAPACNGIGREDAVAAVETHTWL